MTADQLSIFRHSPASPISSAVDHISLGDKIMATLTINGRKIAEIVCDHIADLSQLFEELRAHTQQYSGLASLYILNVTRNWERRRPFMLYPDRYPDGHGGWKERRYRSSDCEKYRAPEPKSETRKRRMAFPWETH